ncbi:ABC-2 family transporter [Actinomadura pelletieri DSM 43383]|uniref:ABC-2 family transporter n=1 Tax=Actinomadura pelletieri DSM 43383 TaxID=1120940 RepID=A0A495QM04_9ACTN|nr:ABC transporter permease subunit [Actinomadura pelletieri]RKS73461.1 ABC-2 family transporter [Actinomadura pelletieri DSM 43383]
MTAPGPTAVPPYRSTVQDEARDGFGRLLTAEWTKLRTVPRWTLTLLASVALTVLVALLTAAGTQATGAGREISDPGRLQIHDLGHYAYQPLAGDGSVIARVTSQQGGGAWAKAGLMVRGSADRATPYAALMVTPGHGVRLQTGYKGDGQKGEGTGTAPRWLRLDRSGTTVTGFESADGRDWRRVGSVTLDGLPRTALAGMFVAAPNEAKVQRRFGGETVDSAPSDTRATFDHVSVSPAWPGARWRDRGAPGGPADPGTGGRTQVDGTYTLAGSGDIGHDPFAEDTTRVTLTGVLLGQVAIVAVAVLFVTAEHRRGMVRTTFAASPRRGRVLAAKAVVVGLASLAAGLVAAFGAMLLAAPVLRAGGLAPPPLSDPAVLRAVLGTAALMGVVAVFALAVAAIVRRSAPAITVVLLLLLLPQIVATGLPLSAARWLERVTPAAGFAMQHTVDRHDRAIGPWAGFGVLCAYTAATLVVATWLVRRRDAA